MTDLHKFPVREQALVELAGIVAQPLMSNVRDEKVIGPLNASLILKHLEAAGFQIGAAMSHKIEGNLVVPDVEKWQSERAAFLIDA